MCAYCAIFDQRINIEQRTIEFRTRNKEFPMLKWATPIIIRNSLFLVRNSNKIQKPLNLAAFVFCELAGTRTQGPYIKSVLLYQLSYQFILYIRNKKLFSFPFFKWSAKIRQKHIVSNFFRKISGLLYIKSFISLLTAT